jgi:DNA-binding response OmpR family regulator
VLNTFLEVLEKGLLLGEIDVDLDKVLLVDPDVEFTEQLAAPLLVRGVRVLRAPSYAKARELVRDYEPELVVSEVHLPDGDPLALLQPDGAPAQSVPTVMFVTSEQSQAIMGQALERGAEDYVLKIVGEKVLLAKIERVLERVTAERARRGRSAAGGVSGRLSEMSLADIVQILATSGKTARIVLQRGSEAGSIWLRDGLIVHAERGAQEGEEAFYRLIPWTDGEFHIETGAAPPRHTIPDASYEGLVLEGLRRMDESRADDHEEVH